METALSIEAMTVEVTHAVSAVLGDGPALETPQPLPESHNNAEAGIVVEQPTKVRTTEPSVKKRFRSSGPEADSEVVAAVETKRSRRSVHSVYARKPDDDVIIIDDPNADTTGAAPDHAIEEERRAVTAPPPDSDRHRKASTDAAGIALSPSDLACLEPHGRLTDNVVNYFLGYAEIPMIDSEVHF